MSYKREIPPVNPTIEQLLEYVIRQFDLIETAIEQIHDHETLHAEPSKLYDGMVRYADGTDWDPGSGEGFYGRENGAWVKL